MSFHSALKSLDGGDPGAENLVRRTTDPGFGVFLNRPKNQSIRVQACESVVTTCEASRIWAAEPILSKEAANRSGLRAPAVRLEEAFGVHSRRVLTLSSPPKHAHEGFADIHGDSLTSRAGVKSILPPRLTRLLMNLVHRPAEHELKVSSNRCERRQRRKSSKQLEELGRVGVKPHARSFRRPYDGGVDPFPSVAKEAVAAHVAGWDRIMSGRIHERSLARPKTAVVINL